MFFRFLHERTIFLGSDYGGWAFLPDFLSTNSIVYSFGIGEDISFDIEIIDKYGVEIYAFDPTPKSINWISQQNLPEKFHFYPFGLSTKDELTTFFAPDNPNFVSHTILPDVYSQNNSIQVQMYKIRTIMQMLGHKKIELIKMDIEGAEFEVIDDLISSQDLNVNQILVEFHHFFPGITKKQTNSSIRKLKQHGYRLFNVSENGNEYSFIKS